jgi:hypothetical protein
MNSQQMARDMKSTSGMNGPKRALVHALLVLVLTASAGCGGGNGPDPGAPPAGTNDSSAPAPGTPVGAAGCAYSYPLPAVSGCDGVLLTTPESIGAKTDGIVETTGPKGLSALRLGAGQTIDLKDVACLQLGKGANDFSVSMWLKAPAGQSQILSAGISQYGGKQGFILYSTQSQGRVVLTLRTDSASHAGSRDVSSAPFDANVWVRATLTYAKNGDGSIASITVNGDTRAGNVYGDLSSDKVRLGEVPGFGHIDAFEIADARSYGRALSSSEVRAQWLDAADQFGVSAQKLGDGIARLRAHFGGKAALDAAAFASAVNAVTSNAAFLPTGESLIVESLGLLDQYEAAVGPLFVRGGTENGIPDQAGANESAVIREARGMLGVFQAVHDEVFRGESVAACNAKLQGRQWATADYFPGKVTSTLDPAQTFSVAIDGTVPAQWGRPVLFVTDAKLRPTGLYLPPGSIARVTVPPELVGAGYAVQIGAHTADHAGKSNHTRLSRTTRRFDIEKEVTYVANPLGGGVYIAVPYLAHAGLVDVQVQGVVEAPIFSSRSFDVTSAAEWKRRRAAGAPWADFVSDHFMMQVPTNWIYAREDPSQILRDWDVSMQAYSEFVGIPPDKRNDVVLFAQPDVQIRATVFGVGYPQVDNLYNPLADEHGDGKAPLITNPLKVDADFHELGHAQLFSKFRGEEEADVNFPFVYVATTKFGIDFDEAFRVAVDPRSLGNGGGGFTPDRAVVDWMVTPNFGNGAEMDHSNTTHDEIRYQQRGFAKYADIARLFGWNALTGFYKQENLDYNAGTPSDGLNEVDSRILRLSVAAGADLTPLIHFWGIHPVEPAKLRAQIVAKGLPASPLVRNLLVRYSGSIPANRAAFLAHFDAVYPGMPPGDTPDFGPGWYQVRKDQWNEAAALRAKGTINALLALYFP